jgi:hypothetical protein
MSFTNPGPSRNSQSNSAAVMVRSNSEAPIPFGSFNANLGSINPLNSAPRWFSIGTLPASYFSTNGTSNTMPLFWLPGGGMVHGIHIYPTSIFYAPSLSTYTVSVGIATNTTLLASAYSCTSILSTDFQLSENFYAFDMVNTTEITITAVSSGVNLNAVKQGTVSVKALLSSLLGT